MTSTKIINKKARFDYEIIETFEVGMQLIGAEVKSLRSGRMSLEGSFVKVIGSEVYLVNAQIFPYPYARPEGYDPKRTRKLLLHKREILALKNKLGLARLTLIPLACYNQHGFFKLKIGLVRGKKEFEKREKIRRKDMERDIQRDLRGKG